MKVTTPQSGVSIVPAPTDWQAFSKVLVIEGAFVGAMLAILTGHGSADVVSLTWALGATLGVLRLSDVAANMFNVRSYLSKPDSGVVPQAANTTLFTTGGNTNASPTTS